MIRDRLQEPVRQLIRTLLASLFVSLLTKPALAESALVEYQVAAGCAAREIFEQQLERRLRLPGEMSGVLNVVVEYTDGTYIGHATLRAKTGATSERVVANGACDQVLQALALVGALLLESEPSVDPKNVTKPTAIANTTEVAPQRVESHEVVIAPSRPKPPARSAARSPTNWVTGPFFGLTADGQFSRDLRVGPRLGWSLTNHALIGKSQLELAASFARLNSGNLDYAQRSADISWNSVRFDACVGSGAHALSSIGGCAWADVGQLKGTGRVPTLSRTQTSIWSRVGAAIHGRQALVGALALDFKLGAMLATTRPEFYFAALDGFSEQSVHRTPLLGLLADLALDLHFW